MVDRGENTAPRLATTTVHDVPDDLLELIFLPPGLRSHHAGLQQGDQLPLDGDGEGISPSNFRIIVSACDQDAVTTSVFTSAADDWRVGGIPYAAPWGGLFFLAGNTQDAVYWTGRDSDSGRSEVLVLDKRTQVFSCSLFPEQLPYRHDPQLRAVRCGDGAVRIALLYRNELRTFVRQNSLGRDEWAEERRIPLPPSIWGLQGAGEAPAEEYPHGGGGVRRAGDGGRLWLHLRRSLHHEVQAHEQRRQVLQRAGVRVVEYQLPWPPTILACLP